MHAKGDDAGSLVDFHQGTDEQKGIPAHDLAVREGCWSRPLQDFKGHRIVAGYPLRGGSFLFRGELAVGGVETLDAETSTE